jgi:ATP-dependent RNA helicase RhlE
MTVFSDLGLNDTLLGHITRQGYTAPTPIQAAAIPAVLGGGDVIGLAQTGTGKTAAFVLPMLQRLMQGPRRPGIKALIVTPTRELAEQINDTIVALGQNTGLRSATVYGGVGMVPQEQALRAGVDIVVACPGRLLDHMDRGYVKLGGLQLLVLDEADRMLDMGFLPAIRRILQKLPPQRQTLLFSATMPPEISDLAQSTTRGAQVIQVDRVQAATTVSHALYPVDATRKTDLLIELLRRTDKQSVLVFTRTKHRANRVAEQIERAGFTSARIHGNRSQNQRQLALDGFRDGRFQVLVATDIAARGIDVSSISHVINYDVPDTPEAYIHRIGRTGRAARTGDAFTLVTTEDAAEVRAIERAIGQKIERHTLDGFDATTPKSGRNDEFARPPLPPRRPQGGQQRPAQPPARQQAPKNTQTSSRPSNAPRRHTSPTRTPQR